MWSWREEPGEPRCAPQGHAWRWTELGGRTCCYRVLNVTPVALQNEIRQAYRRLARTIHPDLRSGAEREVAQREMAELNLAYQTLADPEQRAAYDREHGRR